MLQAPRLEASGVLHPYAHEPYRPIHSITSHVFHSLFLPHWAAVVLHVGFLDMSSLTTPVGRMAPNARLTYLGISAILRRHSLSISIVPSQKRHSSGSYHRSDFTNQSYTGIYDAGAPTEVRKHQNTLQWVP